MNLNFSEYLTIATILIAFSGYIANTYYQKKQSDSSKFDSLNNYKARLSESHEKYRVALKKVNDRHKEEVATLSQAAGNALVAVVGLFDRYDVCELRAPYLRHLVHECSEMIYYAFKGQLGWQTGLNISHRFCQMKHLEDRLEPQFDYFNKEGFRCLFENMYFDDENSYQETCLLNDNYFCGLVGQVKQRLNSAKKGELLLHIQDALQSFNDLFNSLKPGFGKSADYLKEVLEESELDHFKLSESPELLERLWCKKAMLDILRNIQLQEIAGDCADRYYNYVSLSIYTCAILHAVQGVHSWGWNR
ncbi:MAG: hypothetical protein FWD50_02460 [Betaproteobacteria bacterium]|nr:hypothetical protein [Betaproteobacteria bacterium]